MSENTILMLEGIMNKKEFWSNFWSTNRRISNKRTKIEKKNPESIKLGVLGLICCALCLALSVAVAWGVVEMFVLAFSGVYACLLGNFMLLVFAIVEPFFYISYIVAPCYIQYIN